MERIRRFFRRLRKTLNAKGYTLMEVAAVVAVTGTLAAVAMPVVSDKISSAKVTAATMDVQAIKDTIVNFMKDTGVPPFYTTASGSLPKEDTVAQKVLVTRDGEVPGVDPIAANWVTIPNETFETPATIDGQLISNFPLYPTAGTNAWKGPYVPSLKKDPWGNKYVVVIQWLAEPVGQNYSFPSSNSYYGQPILQKAAYVISAGPNGLIETDYMQPIRVIAGTQMPTRFLVRNDDIVSRIN